MEPFADILDRVLQENKNEVSKRKDLQTRTYVCIMVAYRDRSGGRTGLKVNFYAIMPVIQFFIIERLYKKELI